MVETRSYPVDIGGETLILGIARDITARRKSEKEVERIFNMTGYMVCVADMNGYFRRINSSFEQTLGYSSEELLARPFFDFIHPDDRDKTVAVVEEKMSAGVQVIGFENRYRCKDGSYKWFSWTSRPVPEEGIMYAIAYDITERKRAEKELARHREQLEELVAERTAELARSEERLEVAVEGAELGMWDWNIQTGDCLYSDRWLSIIGYGPGEIEPRIDSWEHLLHPDDVHRVMGMIRKNLDGELPFYHCEHRLRTRSGQWKWILARGKVVERDQDGQPLRHAGIHLDIDKRKQAEEEIISYQNHLEELVAQRTSELSEANESLKKDIAERKRAEEKLSLSEEKFSKAFHFSPDSIAITSIDNGRLLEINEGFEKMFGYSRDEAIGRTTVELNIWQSIEDRDAMIKEFEDKGRVKDLEISIRDKAGNIHDCLLSYEAIEIDAGSCLVSIARDITEQKKREKELAEYRNQLRLLVSELTIAEDRERKNIASLLHDDVLQKLALCKMKLSMLRETLTSNDQLGDLDNIHDYVSEMFNDMRALTFDLCPPVLYDIGLEAAVREWLQKEMVDRHEIAVNIETRGKPLHLSEDVRVALYRAVREVLRNVIKHANAHKVDVTLANLDDKVRIEVRDDGIGFERARANAGGESSGGMGLFTVRERLEYFGGSLETESAPCKGSRIILTAALTSREAIG